MINLTALKKAIRIHDPYPAFLTTDLLSGEVQNFLFQSYLPDEQMEKCARSEGKKKHYVFGIKKLLEKNSPCTDLAGLSSYWQELVQELSTEAYIAELAVLTGLDLAGCVMDIGLFRFPQGGWVSPHLDNPEKVLTQIFYFNPEWGSHWGGNLMILAGNASTECCLKVPPLSIYSAIIPRSEAAWHMVEPVSAVARSDRLSLQVEFWEK